jgi:hypothetical protein
VDVAVTVRMQDDSRISAASPVAGAVTAATGRDEQGRRGPGCDSAESLRERLFCVGHE